MEIENEYKTKDGQSFIPDTEIKIGGMVHTRDDHGYLIMMPKGNYKIPEIGITVTINDQFEITKIE